MAAELARHLGSSNLNPRPSWMRTHHPYRVSSEEACRLEPQAPSRTWPQSGPKTGPAADPCAASTASVQRHVQGAARRTQGPPPGVMTTPLTWPFNHRRGSYVLIFPCDGGGGASFRPHGGEACRAVDPSRHRSEDGRDRTVALVAPPFRDRDRARRVRQDDAARGMGPRRIRVPSPGLPWTGWTTTTSCSSGTSPPRFTACPPS
jgi:hypothetical protein